jgi:hypothetical protein
MGVFEKCVMSFILSLDWGLSEHRLKGVVIVPREAHFDTE